MQKTTLVKLTYLTFIVGVASYFMGHSDVLGRDAELAARYIFMASFGLFPLLLMIRVMSALALSGLSHLPVQTLASMYVFFYLVLTKEARLEWTEKISELKEIYLRAR